MKADVKLPDTSGKDKYGQKILYSPKTVETLQFMDHSAINYELIEETLRWIERLSTQEKIARHEGAVLVFLPGMPEISRCLNHLYSTEWFGDESEFTILSLHSQLSDQKTAFQPAAKGKRKIVLSTNIAETGVTIPDIVFVVDAGKVKQNSYHEASNTSSLKEVFVSRAEAIQRKGRAGRVRSGFCFRLYTKRRFDKNFLPAPVPELLRCSLTEPMLSVLVAGFQPTLFRDALDAPPDQRITQALLLLCDVGCAFSSNTTSQMTAALIANYLQNYTGNAQLASNNLQFQITPLGLALAKLPVDIRLGKMLLLGKIFGGSEYLLNTVSALSIASSNRVYLEFMDDAKKQQAKQKQESFYEKLCGKFNGAIVSDHLALAELLRDFEKLGEVKPQEVIDKEDDRKNSSANTGKSYQKESLRQAQERFARSYFVNKSALLQMADVKEDLRGKLEMTTAKSCKGSNSISAQNYEPTTAQLVKKDRPVLAACLVAAGLRPNIARMEHASAMPSTGKGGGKQDGSSNWSLVISAGNEQNIRLHPHSSFLHQSRFLQNQHRWLSYYAKVKTSSLYLRDATVITNPIWFLLFHSEEWDLYPTQRCIVFNNHYTGLGPTSSNSATSNARDWQCVSIAPSTAVILRQLKMRFARVFREWVRSTVSEKGAAGGSSSSSSPYANGQLSPDADRLVTMVKKIIEAKPPTTLSF
ncbi:unnamed protein product [Amoebophrya sp. A120]|nr:unnamed protein product [Amoebophrya sp. A120]|eukprot:GSA120T00024949001.1